MYSPLTETGTREEMLEFREAHPETVPRRVARAGLPGAGEYEGWTPGEALGSLTYGRRADEVNRTYDEAIDALIREEPWNRAGVRELAEQRRAELDVLRDELGMGVGPEEGEEAYRVRSVYGAAPEEEREIRREEVLAAVSEAMPHVGDFTDEEGAADYEAYEAAVEAFFGDLAGSMAGDERLAAIAEEVGEVGVGVAGRGAPGLPTAPVREEWLPVPADVLAGVDQEAVEQYWRRNDSPMEAVQRVWEDAVYGQAWEDYNAAVDGGMEKGEAYEQFIEGAGEVEASDLAAQIQEAYADRWTDEELQEALAGVTFPEIAEAHLLRKPPEEQELARAQGAFWDFLNELLPPGRLASGAKENNLVQLVLDAETRGTATAEQYQKALEFMEGWKARNFDAEAWGTPEEWAEARAVNEQFEEFRDEEFPGITDLLSRYYDLPAGAERRAFREEHPEISQYYDFRDWFGAEEGNEVWARYYLRGGETRVAGTAGWTSAWRGRGRGGRQYRRSYRRRSRGRRGKKEPDWKFARLAERPPKVFLKTPLAWEGKLAERFEPYRARGTPWVFGKWRKK